MNRRDLIDLLKSNEHNEQLFTSADTIRREQVGNAIHLRGLINFSNICKRHCQYCGLRADNNTVNRFRMSKEELVNIVRNAVNIGYKSIVLQSGEDDFYTTAKICEIVSALKEFDVAVVLSIGEKSYEEYKAYREAGADRYLLKIETTDETLYKKMHPHADFQNRVRCLYDLKELGYELGTGDLVGLPNQSLESLADDILFFKKIEADMLGIGPFIAHPQTPLGKCPNGDLTLALKVLALNRLLLKDINMPATTAMETLVPQGRLKALQSGANVVMLNLTESSYRDRYEIYPRDNSHTQSILKEKEALAQEVATINRTISTSHGFHISKHRN